jgi:hypothetical protein
MRTLEQINADAEALEKERKKAEYLATEMSKIWNAHPWVSRSVATTNMILDYCGDVYNVSLDSFNRLLKDSPSFLHDIGGQLSPTDQQDERLKVIARLAEMLDKVLPTGPARQFELKRRFGALSLNDLLLKEQEIQMKRAQASKSVEELREELRQHTQANQPQRYSPLPSELIPPGKVRGVPWSFTLIRKLSETEGGRRFVQSLFNKYSEAAITEACRKNQLKGDK